MAFSAKSLRLLSYVHLVLGILAMAAGIASMNVTDYYSGLFGMGIWLGAWVCVEYKQFVNEKSYCYNLFSQLSMCVSLQIKFKLISLPVCSLLVARSSYTNLTLL